MGEVLGIVLSCEDDTYISCQGLVDPVAQESSCPPDLDAHCALTRTDTYVNRTLTFSLESKSLAYFYSMLNILTLISWK